MENTEEVFQILERFSKLKQKDIPKELDDYLCFVAKTGDTVYRWPMIKHLFREKLMQVIKDFYESTPSIADLPQDPNVDPFNYESMKNALLERLELFNAAPFTVQRICELLTDPRKQYSRIDKFMRAIEKNILVVSTTEPGRKRGESETAESVDSVINGDLSSESVDSDENDITFADLTAKLTNDNKVENNATEAKENGNTEKPDVDMKDSVPAAVAEPETTAQPSLPSLAENKIPAEKPEELKPVEAKEPELVSETPETTIVVENDKPTEMEEDKSVVKNDKPDTTTPGADEAMPIEENKTEDTSNIIVPNITITSVPEENGVVPIVKESKVTENGDTDVELKLTEEIISATAKSPSKPVPEIASKTEPSAKKEEIEKVEEKREPEDLLDEPEPKKLRTESNYSTVPVVEITPATPQKKEEEMAVEPTKEPEIIEKLQENSATTEKPKEVAHVKLDEPMKTDKIVEEKENSEKPDVVNTPTKVEPKEEIPPESRQKENGEIKLDSITEVETSAPVPAVVVVENTESADVNTSDKVEELEITEPIVVSKPIEEDKPTEPVVETPAVEAETPTPVVEESVLATVVEEPTVVSVVTEEKPVVIEAVVAPVVEDIIVPVIPVVEVSVLPVVLPVEEEKPIITPVPEILTTSIEVVTPVSEVVADAVAATVTLIDVPVPVEETVNIPAPLSPMQSSETTQEMDTNSNENKMDADDVVDGNNATEAATLINKAAADDNAMEVDDSVEPMDQ